MCSSKFAVKDTCLSKYAVKDMWLSKFAVKDMPVQVCSERHVLVQVCSERHVFVQVCSERVKSRYCLAVDPGQNINKNEPTQCKKAWALDDVRVNGTWHSASHMDLKWACSNVPLSLFLTQACRAAEERGQWIIQDQAVQGGATALHTGHWWVQVALKDVYCAANLKTALCPYGHFHFLLNRWTKQFN